MLQNRKQNRGRQYLAVFLAHSIVYCRPKGGAPRTLWGLRRFNRHPQPLGRLPFTFDVSAPRIASGHIVRSWSGFFLGPSGHREGRRAPSTVALRASFRSRWPCDAGPLPIETTDRCRIHCHNYESLVWKKSQFFFVVRFSFLIYTLFVLFAAIRFDRVTATAMCNVNQ